MPQNTLRNSIQARDLLSIPNQLSLLRLVLIPFVLYYYLDGQVKVSGILLIVSAFTDVADGFIARRFNQITNLGKMLDPLADKLTQICVAICLCIAYRALIPMALVLAVKELLMMYMGLTMLRRGQKPIAARWWGKLTTVTFYSVAIVVMLFGDKFSANLIRLLSAVVALLLCYSLFRYYQLLRNQLTQA